MPHGGPRAGRGRRVGRELTTALLAELKDTEQVRDKPVACGVLLALAVVSGAVAEHLDALHRQALRTATGSVCRA